MLPYNLGICYQPRQHIKKQRHYFVNKGLCSQGYGFSSGHAWMWELHYKESWVPKNWSFLTVVLEKTLESPWTARRSNQSILKEISPGCSLEGLLLKLKLQYFGHLMWRTDSFEKTLMLGKIESRRRRGGQDEVVGWHHRLNGHEFEQTLGVGDGQGVLTCCSPWGHKESDTTERLNWTVKHSGALRKTIVLNYSLKRKWNHQLLEFNNWYGHSNPSLCPNH